MSPIPASFKTIPALDVITFVSPPATHLDSGYYSERV